DVAIGRGEFRWDAIEVHSLTRVEVTKDADELLESFERGGLFAQDAARAVAPADAEFHASTRGDVERGEEAGGNRHVADSGIGDARAEAKLLGVCGRQREEGKRLLPDDMGVENPAKGETGGLCLLGEAQDAVDGDVRFDGDAKVHGWLRD